MIIERLKYCIEILFSKHYALYYYNRGMSGKCRIKASKEFLEEVINITQKILEEAKNDSI